MNRYQEVPTEANETNYDTTEEKIIEELSIKLQYLIDWIARNHGLPEQCFTFPDGDTWYTSDYEPKS